MGLRDESKPSPASQSQEFIVTIDSLLASSALSKREEAKNPYLAVISAVYPNFTN